MAHDEKDHVEWIKQADYDMQTADVLFAAGRYIYCVFMCHLAVEKALKACYRKNMEARPPRSHDLLFILGEAHVEAPRDYLDFLDSLSALSVPARYPRDISKMARDYNEEKTRSILERTHEVYEWLKTTLAK